MSDTPTFLASRRLATQVKRLAEEPDFYPYSLRLTGAVWEMIIHRGEAENPWYAVRLRPVAQRFLADMLADGITVLTDGGIHQGTITLIIPDAKTMQLSIGLLLEQFSMPGNLKRVILPGAEYQWLSPFMGNILKALTIGDHRLIADALGIQPHWDRLDDAISVVIHAGTVNRLPWDWGQRRVAETFAAKQRPTLGR